MSYINKQNNNYKINNYNYLTKNNLKHNDIINNLDQIIDNYMIKYLFDDIKDYNKFKVNNNSKMVLKERTINFTKRNTLYNTKYNIVDNNIEIILFIYEKSNKNKLLFNYLTNKILKDNYLKLRNKKSDISLNLLIKHNHKSLYYINSNLNENNNNNYSNLEDYINNIITGYNIKIKPIVLKYPQMDNKIFNNYLMFKQTKQSNIIWGFYRRLFKRMKLINHKTIGNIAINNIKKIENNINKDINKDNIPLNTINKDRNSILSNYLLYKRIVGLNLKISGQYLTKKKKRKVKAYSMNQGPLYNSMSLYNKDYNSLTFNKYPGYISVYSKPSTYNKTIIGKIGLNTKITLV